MAWSDNDFGGNYYYVAAAGGPNIAFDGSNYLVVWYTGAYPGLELYGQLISPQGAFVDNPISIAHGRRLSQD